MKKWIPIIIIIILMLIVYFSGVTKYLTFETIKENRQLILSYIDQYPLLMPFLFTLIYVVMTALSLPGGALLSILGGFIFGVPLSTIYVVVGATIGATIIFSAARTAMGDLLKRKAGPFLLKMETGFQKNAASYLLFLRLIPLFPFWLVNIAPAFFNVKTRTYLWTTFLGIIPGAYVFTQAGNGLGAIFDSGKELSVETVFNIEIKIALIVLALFALIPIFVKRLRRDR
ncbi:MAG: TVP38/TMEM64 family protein [Chlamydiales bacterium]|nr:TVP38/TMEM64 family protein [Chlamydiales bacterium]